MTIKANENAGKLALDVIGRLDTTTAPQLEAELAKHSDASAIEFNFAELEYISSAGLRVLLGAQKGINAKKGTMVIKNVNDTIREVFEITGFIDILTIE